MFLPPGVPPLLEMIDDIMNCAGGILEQGNDGRGALARAVEFNDGGSSALLHRLRDF